MNSDNPFSRKTDEVQPSNFHFVPGRLPNSRSAYHAPGLRTYGSASSMGTRYFEVGSDANNNIETDVRNLRKSLDLPKEPLLHNRSHWFSQFKGGANSVASQVYLTDSGYSSNHHSFEGLQNVEGFRNAGYNSNPTLTEMKTTISSQSSEGSFHELQDLHGLSFYEKSLKSSLQESETKRVTLLEKLREAHLTIQNQAEKLAAAESEMCILRGQLKGMGIEQEGLQQEVECLMMEKRTFEVFRVESVKNRDDFLARINDLDKALRILTVTHNTLQSEAEEKEAMIEQAETQLKTLEQDKKKLLEVNENLKREISTLKTAVDKEMSYKSDVTTQLEQLKNNYQNVVRDKAVVKHQLSQSLKVIQEARGKQDKMKQEIVQLKMERDVQFGKFCVLEEEILHYQQSNSHLVREQEIVLKDKAEQERRLQMEIREKMNLKLVNDLLKEESANVKEAFKKLEQFTNVVERKSEELSEELDQYKQGSQSGKPSEVSQDFLHHNDNLLLKIDSLNTHCTELQSKLDALEESNRKLMKENEQSKEQTKLIKMQEEALTKQQMFHSKQLKKQNEDLKQQLTISRTKNEDLQNRLQEQKEKVESTLVKSRESSVFNIARVQQENIELQNECERLRSAQVQLEAEKKELFKTNEKLSLEMAKLKGKDHYRETFHVEQGEIDVIKESLARLESEKALLTAGMERVHDEHKACQLQNSELKMSQTELEAENIQLRSELGKMKRHLGSVGGVKNLNMESDTEEAVKRAKNSMKVSFDDVCLELKNVKSELSKVWEMLEHKEKQFEEQTQELEEEREQCLRLTEEVNRLRKMYAELTAKTSTRSQMIVTLRDELTQRCDEITNLEAKLTDTSQQKFSVLSKFNGQNAGVTSKRRRSDGDINMSGTVRHCCDGNVNKVITKNTQLNERVKELVAERDSAVHDAQDLLSGMQQLREAFEDEMERELEREREKFEREKDLLLAQQAKTRETDQQLFVTKFRLQKEFSRLTEEKTALETKSKNLEFERDELRNQVEELCRMRTGVEEKAVQVDGMPLSPRRRENKLVLTRKRSKSVGLPPPTPIKENP